MLLQVSAAGAETNAAEEAQYRAHAMRTLPKDAARRLFSIPSSPARLPAQASADGWPGLLVGDMAQPRGGPILTGHASHQLGLEVDLWLTPAPAGRLLSSQEREEMSAINMVRPDLLEVDGAHFGPAQVALLRRAALMPEVDRLFVNAAIKQAACRAEVRFPKPDKRPQKILKLRDLPAACRAVLGAP